MTVALRPMTGADLARAAGLFVERHRERRAANPLYPDSLDSTATVEALLEGWLSTGEGIVAEQSGDLAGYLVGRVISGLGGVQMSFMPEWAHATRADAGEAMFSALYREWCRLPGRRETTLHTVVVFADDAPSHDDLVRTGFGRHLIDGGREVGAVEPVDLRLQDRPGVDVSRPTLKELDRVNEMEAELNTHLNSAPIFRPETPGGGHVYDRTWIERPSKGLWVSRTRNRSGGEITGFMSAECGAQEPKSLMSLPVPHITGAFLSQDHRGSGAANALLGALLGWAAESGWKSCTVDFETSNPEGAAFWLGPAGFEPLLYTMARRLDPRYASTA